MKSILLGVCIAASSVLAFQTASGPGNPFNANMSGTGGVDLFSGNAVQTQNLLTLKGTSGLGVSATLQYSSNIYNNVRARNQVAPTSWVGLGWQLSYGTIICDHNGTTPIADDKYVYISPAGVKEDILVDYATGKFYGKQSPYVKFERQLNDQGFVKGWIVRMQDGTKYKYGDIGYSDSRNATWYTFSWTGTHQRNDNDNAVMLTYDYKFVGQGFQGTPQLYGWRWDLSEIENAQGNKARFYYAQTKEMLKASGFLVDGDNQNFQPVWDPAATDPTLQYTKASYVDRIVSPEGWYMRFFLGDKNPGEYCDPWTFQPEPDAYMELYEDKFLDKVVEYTKSNQVVRTVKLEYSIVNETVNPNYKKRLLTSIRNQNGAGADFPGGPTSFSYSTDLSKSDESDYHYGALSSVRSPAGGTVTYTYQRKTLQGTANMKKLQAEAKSPSDNDFGIFGDKKEGIASSAGTLTGGYEYLAVRGGDGSKKLWVLRWNGMFWEMTKTVDASGNEVDFWGLDLGEDTKKYVSAGRNYFVVRYNDRRSIMVFNWDGEKWVRTYQETIGATAPVFTDAGDGFFTVRCYTSDPRKLRIYNWSGTAWTMKLETESLPGDREIETLLGSNYVLVLCGGDKHIRAYNWNGSQWQETLRKEIGDAHRIYVTAGPDFFAVTYNETPPKNLRIYKWDGYKWFTSKRSAVGVNNGIFADAGSFYVALRHGALGTKDDLPTMLHIYTWTGGNWSNLISGTEDLGADYGLTAVPGDDYLVLRHVVNKELIVYNWDGVAKIWQRTYQGYLSNSTAYPCPGRDAPKEVVPAPNFILAYSSLKQRNTGFMIWGLLWDGTTWQKVEQQCYTLSSNVKTVYEISSSTAAKDVTGCTVTYYEDTWLSEDPALGCKFFVFKRYQDNLDNDIYGHVVVAKTVDNGSGKTLVTNLSYPRSNYDTEQNSFKHHDVDVAGPTPGKTASTFYSGLNTPGMGPDRKKLDGLVWKATVYAADNAKIVSSTTNDYVAYRNVEWPIGLYQKRLSKATSSMDGVVSASEILAYDSHNGMPMLVSKANSDGKTLLSQTVFAHDAYTDLAADNVNMLTQGCQSITYSGGYTADKALASTATTWRTDNGRWLPQGRYAWRMSMDNSTGYPTQGLSSFPFFGSQTQEPSTLPSGWLCGSRITKYGIYAQPLETVSNPLAPSLSVFSTTVYDGDEAYPIAAVTNARYGECLYTSWEDRTTADLSKDPTAGALIDAAVSHSGTKSLQLSKGTATDPWVFTDDTPTPGMSATKAVRWEFWAKASAASTNSFTHLQSPVDNTWYGDMPFTVGTSWQKFSFVVSVPAGKQYHVVLRPPVTTGHTFTPTGTIWYDDVRAYPSDAMMTSYTYDPVLGVPTSVTDANNNTTKTTYDGFGRVTAQYNTKGQKVKEFEYHVRGSSDIPIYTNHFESGSDPSFAPTTGHCAAVSRAAGYSGQGDYIDFCETNVEAAYLSLPKDKMNGKKFTVSGYVKGTAGDLLTVIIVPTSENYQFMAMNGQWQRFEIVADWTGKNYSKADLWIFPEGPYNINVSVDEVSVLGE